MRLRQIAANDAGRLQTIQVWHADVHDDEIGAKLLRFFDRVLPIHGFTANFAVFARRQQSAHASANYLVIISYQNSHSSVPSRVHAKKLPCSPRPSR